MDGKGVDGVGGGQGRDREGLNSVGSMLEGGDVGDDGYTKMERQQMVNLSNLNARLDRLARLLQDQAQGRVSDVSTPELLQEMHGATSTTTYQSSTTTLPI